MLKDFLENFKRLVRGDPAPGRPEPRCDACFDRIVGPGYRYRGQLFCDIWCCPPFQIHGDPGHA